MLEADIIKTNTLDIVIIAFYMLITMGIGVYFKKFSSSSMENFFLGGRQVPGWANGFSYAATCLNSDVAPGYVGWAVGTGLFVCWLYISRFGLALMIGGLLFALFWRKLKLFTSPEFYELRFPGKIGWTVRSWVSIRSVFIANIAWSATGLLGLCKVAEPVFGWSKIQTMVIIVPFVLLYVSLSGYLGVIATDVFQSIVIILSGLAMCVFVLVDFNGPTGLFNSLLENLGPELGADVLRSFPPPDHSELGLVAIIAWFVGTGIGYGGDVTPVSGSMEGQRILSCRNGRESVKMYLWMQIILFGILLMLTLPGLGALAKWPELYHQSRAERELVFGRLLEAYLPSGVLGLSLAAMMASIMSTLSSYLNFGSQVATYDIYKRMIHPSSDEKHLIWVSRVVMAILCFLSVYVALRLESIITLAIFMLGFSSAEYAANWAQWWWWRFNSYSRLTASLGGPIIFMFIRFALSPLFASYTGYVPSEWEQILVSIGLTTLIWFLVTLLTPPQDEKILMQFYKRAHPLGFWGPIRTKLGLGPEKHRYLIGKGFCLAVLGAAWFACIVLLVSNLFVGKYKVAAGLGAGAIIGCMIFPSLFNRYVNMLSERTEESLELREEFDDTDIVET